jgi:predicted amidohydrolase YtcJ
MLVLRNVRPWGARATDVAIAAGRITAMGVGLQPGAEEIDGKGGILLPGLHDHHLHLMALAARRQSVNLAGMVDEAQVAAALRAFPGPAVRAVDYDERAAGLPDAAVLDRWVSDRPMRLADRTGALWVLNQAALRTIEGRVLPEGAERDAEGRPTGRFWREDRWLRSALATVPPDLAALGSELAALGLTGLTDATAHNGPDEAALLVGKLPQRLTLMGSEMLGPGAGYALGALKLLIDERDLPEPEVVAARIRVARTQGRPVAAHCVTEAELALYLAALDLAGGARRGDRVEHGGMIPVPFVPVLAASGLIVVTNPGFIHDRGERYRSEVPPEHWDELYPAATLLRAGVPLLAGSDAPYSTIDPWIGMRSARERLTALGAPIGISQRLDGLAALHLYCQGTIELGATADLVLVSGSLDDVLSDLTAQRVQCTLIAGTVAFLRP